MGSKFFSFLLMLTGVFSFSQYTEIINSNRPGSSHGAFAVGAVVLQFGAAVSGHILKYSNLNNSEISKFLFGYGIEGNTKKVNKKIKRWSLMNTYTELIWAKYINKFNKNFLNEEYLELLTSKIKQQKL